MDGLISDRSYFYAFCSWLCGLFYLLALLITGYGHYAERTTLEPNICMGLWKTIIRKRGFETSSLRPTVVSTRPYLPGKAVGTSYSPTVQWQRSRRTA